MPHPLRVITRRRLAAAGTGIVALALAAPLLGQPASAAPLAAPQPVDSQGAGPKEVTLAWSPVAGADSYVVQIGTDESWSGPPTLELPTVATRLTLPVWLPHADYAWRVAAVQGDKARGRWSAPGAATSFHRGWPDRPLPLTPAADETVNDLPAFSWTPVPTASEYELQASTSPTFDNSPPPGTGPVVDNGPVRQQASPSTDTCFTTRTSITPFQGQATAKNATAGPCLFTHLQAGADLYWRVRPLDHVADTVQEVDTTPVVGSGVSHLPPVFGGDQAKLDLSGCPAPGGRVSPSGSATPSAAATATSPPAGSPTALPVGSPAASAPPASPVPSGTASAASGGCQPANSVEAGGWSTTTRFAFRLPPVRAGANYRTFAPAQTRPLPAGQCTADGLCRDAPTLSWSRVDGATAYRLYVALDAAYTNIQEVVDTPGTTWTPTAQFRQSSVKQSYYYAVQACTDEGCGAVPSAPASFRVAGLPVTGLGQTVTRSDVELRWDDYAATLAAATGVPATSEAYAYRVQVARADDQDFTGELVDDETVDPTHHVSATKAYGDGAFRWRVQALDASAHPLPWSAPATFSRDSTPPTVLRVAPTDRMDPSAQIGIRFSEPVTGIDAASVRLAGVAGRVTQVPGEPTLVTLKPAAPLSVGGTYDLLVGPGISDETGNPIEASSRSVTVATTVDDASPAFRYSAGWTTARSTDARQGTFHVTRGGTVSFPIQGTGVVIGGCVGPTDGIVEVWVDGRRQLRTDGYRAYSGCTVLTTVRNLPRGEHRIELRTTGDKRPAARAAALGLDAVRVLP